MPSDRTNVCESATSKPEPGSRALHAMTITVERVSSSAKRLYRDDSGGAGIVFAVALVPLLGFAGFALDYARISLARADLQAAVDAAGLAIALLPRTTPIKDVQQRALDRVNASLAGKGLGQITMEATRTGTN